MSKKNPRKAMAALLPPGQAVIRPMTLGVYAALERIGSPIVTGVPAKDTLELIPSLYLLTHDPREVFRGNIVDLAMQWADTVPVNTLAEIKDAADAQIRALSDVLPEIEDEPKKKRRLDRRVRRLGGEDLPLALRGNPLGSPGLRAHPPQTAGGAPQGAGLHLPAPGNRGD